jgi:hypothetical protein
VQNTEGRYCLLTNDDMWKLITTAVSIRQKYTIFDEVGIISHMLSFCQLAFWNMRSRVNGHDEIFRETLKYAAD